MNRAKYETEAELTGKLVEALRSRGSENYTFMEVCGTHTVAIFRSGIRSILPENIRIISGPGCPVCVTPMREIDQAIYLAKKQGVVLATFGDLMRVPGSESSLLEARADGARLRIVLSPMDAVELAQQETSSTIVFFAVGFETTIAPIAVAVREAYRRKLGNFFVLPSLRRIPPAIETLLAGRESVIDGFILPGHVSVIIGTEPYEFISRDFKVPGVVTGFDPLDILQGLWMLLRLKLSGESRIEIQYRRAVSREGNVKALRVMHDVFRPTDSHWRGLGKIPASGLALRDKYSSMDARRHFDIPEMPDKKPSGCICGQILQGLKIPTQCKLFGSGCTPEHPVGPCMVSSEGSCSAFYRYAIRGEAT